MDKKITKGAGHCIRAANMSVTVAVEAVRSRGYLSKYDVRGMSAADFAEYEELSRIELGVQHYDPRESEES